MDALKGTAIVLAVSIFLVLGILLFGQDIKALEIITGTTEKFDTIQCTVLVTNPLVANSKIHSFNCVRSPSTRYDCLPQLTAQSVAGFVDDLTLSLVSNNKIVDVESFGLTELVGEKTLSLQGGCLPQGSVASLVLREDNIIVDTKEAG